VNVEYNSDRVELESLEPKKVSVAAEPHAPRDPHDTGLQQTEPAEAKEEEHDRATDLAYDKAQVQHE
jgi:hypothetical protein